MRVRIKNYLNGEGFSNRFNTHGLAEVIVQFDEGGEDSMFIKDLDVFVNGAWKDMNKAFNDKDLITDNYNTMFFVPENDEEKFRGYRFRL
jgi:hypothetical protein